MGVREGAAAVDREQSSAVKQESKIRVLPPEVIAQIAAGEVVERPFSVVKELIENALDAGAHRLRVELKDGGLAAIRVIDDGRGFVPEDLALAFISHATSKLAALGDLDHVASLGFRGEALASIGSVSRASIRSRAEGAADGAEIRCEGGVIGEVKPCGTPLGTRIEIRDLFFNTPARRRFLKSARAERSRIHDLLIRTVLPALDVDVTLVHDSKVLLHLPAGEDLQQRIVRAFGKTYAGRLWTVGPTTRGKYMVHGLIAEPELSRRDGTMEFAWVNGRAARDRSTMFAVREAFRGHVLHGRYPVTFLMLEVPPDKVDVNCHPTKVEVRFAEARQVAGLMHEAVRNALEQRGGATALAQEQGAAVLPPPDPGPISPRPRAGFPKSLRDTSSSSQTPPPGLQRGSLFEPDSGAAASGAQADQVAEEVPDSGLPAAPAKPNPFHAVRTAKFLQVHDLYVVLATEDGLAVVDQHALHERVVYERLVRRHSQGPPEIQRLLMPAVIELPAPDKEWLLASAEVLAEEGFLVEDFGGGHAVAVQGIPAALGQRADPERLVRAMVDADRRPSARDEVLERFHSMACRSSVMSGDRLDESEIAALLEEAGRLEHPHNCPHGRPTVLTFGSAELERWFRRRV